MQKSLTVIAASETTTCAWPEALKKVQSHDPPRIAEGMFSRQDAPACMLTDKWSSAQADIAILLRLEAAMKRPDHGLLKRMIRLTEIDHEDLVVDGKARRVLSLQSGAEYHIALQILTRSREDSSRAYAAEWLSISMPGSLPLRIQVTCGPVHLCPNDKQPGQPSIASVSAGQGQLQK